jgi:hypothetical protein
MPPTRVRSWVVAVWGTLALLVPRVVHSGDRSSGRTSSEASMVEQAGSIPEVKVSLGDDIHAVAARSSYPFKKSTLDGRVPLIITEPVALTYLYREERSVKFPPALFLDVGLVEGHVVFLKVSPHLELMPLAEAFALIQETAKALEEAGFKPSDRPMPALESLVKLFSDPLRSATTVQSWQAGGDRVYINLQRNLRAQQLPALQPGQERGDLFSIVVHFENAELRRKYQAKRREKRVP